PKWRSSQTIRVVLADATRAIATSVVNAAPTARLPTHRSSPSQAATPSSEATTRPREPTSHCLRKREHGGRIILPPCAENSSAASTGRLAWCLPFVGGGTNR